MTNASGKVGVEMRSRALVVLVLFSAVTSLSCAAHAQSSGKSPPGYAEAVSQGLSELEAGNFPEAREEFRRAHAIFPNARTLRGLGMVEFELRNYGESVRRLEEALASSVRPLEGKPRSDAEALLARAKRYLGELRVATDPDGARVLVDGDRVEVGAEGALLLEVGEHTVEVQAPGRASEKRVVQVMGGERTDLRVVLGFVPGEQGSAAPTAAPLDLAPHAGASERQPVYKKWWLWTAVVLVAAGGATAAVLLITRDHETKTGAVDGINTTGVSLQTLSRF